jgi:serine/threonine protein kinase
LALASENLWVPVFLSHLFGAASPLTAYQQVELARSLRELPDFADAAPISDSKPAEPKIPIPLQLKPGDRFSADGIRHNGRFEMIAKVGQGGMGVFYKVFDHKQQRVVGLKALLQNAGDVEVLRFDNEIKIGSQLDHDHLVTVYETIEFADGSRGMLMKFIDGEPLSKVLNRLTYRQAIDILLDVASGVAHMHALGFLHRDLKPDNILIRASDGRAFVTDFGIAKSMKEPVSAAESLSLIPAAQSIDLTGNSIIGTLGFFDSGVRQNDEARDLFALGGILYQLMADGRQIFRAYDAKGQPVREPAMEIAKRVSYWVNAIEKNQNPTWKIAPPAGQAAQGNDDAPGEILRIIHKCLRRKLPHRFPTVGDLMADLLKVKTTKLKKEIEEIEQKLDKAMKVPLPTFLTRSGVTIDPALNPEEMTEDELSDLLSCPVTRKDGTIWVTAGTRDFLPPLERQALDEMNWKLSKRVNLLRAEISFVANRILAKGWPLKHVIAESTFDFLVHQQYELSQEEMGAWIPFVTDYERPLPDGLKPMTQALIGKLDVVVEDMRDYTTGDYVQTATAPRVYRLVERGETGQYWPGEDLDIAALSLKLGDILVLQLENEAYAPVSIPIQASLKKRKELVDRLLPLTVSPELIPKDLVDEGFTVIHGGSSVVGVRYGREDGRYSIPQMEFRYGPFAVKTATLSDYLKKFLRPLVQAGHFTEAEQRAPRWAGKTFFPIDRSDRTISIEEKDAEKNFITLTQNVRGVTPADLFAFAKYLGLEVIDSFRWEVVATNGIQGFISPTGSTVRAIYLPSFNGVENWYRDAETKTERPRDPGDIQVPEMDSIPADAERSDNITLVHGVLGLLGPGLHATSTPGTIRNIVTKGVSLTATTDAVNFNARKEQMRPKDKPFQVSDYAALLIKKFYRKK